MPQPQSGPHTADPVRHDLDRVLDDPSGVQLALQRLVDLRRGVVAGHEVLARPAGPPHTSPDRWFAAAARHGLSGALAARVLIPALDLLEELPANTFLTVNLEPDDVTAPEVRAVLADRDRLDRLVVEVTERRAIDEASTIHADLADLRRRGARVAVDDAGAGYAGLQALLSLRPELVKLDQTLVRDIDADPAKRALLLAIGDFADSIDAWVLAEGIETTGELDELVRLRVPLGQGYLLGRPSATFTPEIPADLLGRIQQRLAANSLGPRVATLVQEAITSTRTVPPESVPHRLDHTATVFVVDRLGRPQAVRRDSEDDRPAMTVKLSEGLADAARRVATRRDGFWYDPLAVIDGRGELVGMLSVPRLLEALARQTSEG